MVPFFYPSEVRPVLEVQSGLPCDKSLGLVSLWSTFSGFRTAGSWTLTRRVAQNKAPICPVFPITAAPLPALTGREAGLDVTSQGVPHLSSRGNLEPRARLG